MTLFPIIFLRSFRAANTLCASLPDIRVFEGRVSFMPVLTASYITSRVFFILFRIALMDFFARCASYCFANSEIGILCLLVSLRTSCAVENSNFILLVFKFRQ